MSGLEPQENQTSQATRQDLSYLGLNYSTTSALCFQTEKIKSLVSDTATNIIKIGEHLIKVKELLDHGQFGLWIERELAWSESTAQRFMRVASQFKSVTVTDLKISSKALYLLASPSTPDEVRSEFIDKARDHEEITHKAVKDSIENKKLREHQASQTRRSIKQKERISFLRNLERLSKKGLHLFCHLSERDTIKLLESFIIHSQRLLEQNLYEYEQGKKQTQAVFLKESYK